MDVSDRNQATEERHCEEHGPYTSIRVHVTAGGREFWTGCQPCTERSRVEAQERMEQEWREKRIAAQRESLERNLQRACIPQRFRDRTFDNFEVDSAGKKAALQVARGFMESFENHEKAGTFVVFSGRPGTGKSHLACAIASAVARTGRSSLYATARELVLMLRDTWRHDSDRSERQAIDQLVSVNLLVIDEVGVGFGSDAEKTQFFDIIDGRYREQMPTILLTNLDRKGLAEYIGQRAFDRLREGGIWVPFDWESYRGGCGK